VGRRVSAERFGPYRLDEVIGRGGMGEVYRAYDTVKNRTVALKRLPPLLATDSEFQTRFRREAEIVARLREPHIIPIHDYGEIDGRLFIDMRLVEGVDLSSLIGRHGPLSPTRAVNIVVQIAAALTAAHTEGLVHRDIKTSNVLISGANHEVGPADDYVYLVDFGIARSGTATSFTAAGAPIGTLDYMAPEQFLGQPVDRRADIYALGCLLYEILTGKRPFCGEGFAGLMYAHLNTAPPRASQQPGVPAALDQVVIRAMAKNPNQRYRSSAEMAAAARATLLDASPQAVPRVRPSSKPSDAPRPRRDRSLGSSVGRDCTPRRWRATVAATAVFTLIGLVAFGIVVINEVHSTTPFAVPMASSYPVGKHPEHLAITLDGRHVYVTNYGSHSVSVLDTANLSTLGGRPFRAENWEGCPQTPGVCDRSRS
jgi:serine/threonine protein kinase, bacterial